MQYRKLRADKIFDGFNWLSDHRVLVIDETGLIKDIISITDAGEEIEELKGILLPGLVNAHCHLELSHLKNAVPTHTGLVPFLLTVIKNRNYPLEEILSEAEEAEKEMFENGTVAVADISNTAHTVDIKKGSRICWHNLVEVINLNDENIEKQIEHYNSILQAYRNLNHSAFLTPHAPYSLTPTTLETINSLTADSVISIHNQESQAENELFKKGTGAFLNLYSGLGYSSVPLKASSTTSLQTWLPKFTNSQTIILVHNSFISEEDIVFAKKHAEAHGLNIVYCLCPNANLYIENTLPPIELLFKHSCKIVLGTDSLSSNWQLSIAAEIKTIIDHFPHLPLATVLSWATRNGAETLRFAELGALSKGKKPGIVLLETDVDNKLTGASKRII